MPNIDAEFAHDSLPTGLSHLPGCGHEVRPKLVACPLLFSCFLALYSLYEPGKAENRY